jgi:hypothetical protein
MVCENCKHEIGPDQKFCPKCGAKNVFAEKHEENMQQFAKDYAATEKEVKSFGQAMEGLGKKAAILAALLIGIIVCNILTSMNYADPDEARDAAIRSDAEKNIETYMQQADSLLESGAYMEYVNLLYAHQLSSSMPEEMNRFRQVTYVAREYYECIDEMEQMILRSDDPDYFDGLDTDIETFCMYLDGFYEVYEVQKDSEKDEIYLGYILDMEEDLRAMVRTYLAMDEDGLQEFLNMSEAQKAVKVREVLRHE